MRMAKISSMRTPRVNPTPRTYPEYLDRQRQTAMFKQLSKPAKLKGAKLTPASAARIRKQTNAILGKG
jgi:hypothetical protein